MRHLPFSVSAVAIGLTIAGIICFLTPAEQVPEPAADHAEAVPTEDGSGSQSESPVHAHGQHGHGAADAHDGHQHDNPFFDLFHLFHPVHMLFSAAATTAMFWRYDRRVLKAVITGLIGAIGVCGLSDIVMPHISLSMLGKSVPWHICVIEHPQMVLSFAMVGVVVGLAASKGVRSSTFFSHSLHVFSSTMASIFYLIGPFGRLGWIDSVGIVFLFIIVAVMVPCCLSDIVFPLLLAKGARKKYRDEHVGCAAD
ncbi:MAG: hypothetical protein JXQ75_19025 [Phycisphaerae bacterium]|nr:hypothetical protein [Phycisphaerae bacterium]